MALDSNHSQSVSVAQLDGSSGSLANGFLPTVARLKQDYLLSIENGGYKLNLWTLSSPFSGSILNLYPCYAGGTVSGTLRFLNSRGECFNECSVASRSDQSISLDLDSFLEGCETDSGFRHAHLEVLTNSPCFGHVQLSTTARSVLMPPLHTLTDIVPRSIPLSFAKNLKHILALVNPADRQVSVRCRLFLGTRSPEEACLVPPNGVLIISPEILFSGIVDDTLTSVHAADSILGYIKLITRSSHPIGVQLLEEASYSTGERVIGVIE